MCKVEVILQGVTSESFYIEHLFACLTLFRSRRCYFFLFLLNFSSAQGCVNIYLTCMHIPCHLGMCQILELLDLKIKSSHIRVLDTWNVVHIIPCNLISVARYCARCDYFSHLNFRIAFKFYARFFKFHTST